MKQVSYFNPISRQIQYSSFVNQEKFEIHTASSVLFKLITSPSLQQKISVYSFPQLIRLAVLNSPTSPTGYRILLITLVHRHYCPYRRPFSTEPKQNRRKQYIFLRSRIPPLPFLPINIFRPPTIIRPTENEIIEHVCFDRCGRFLCCHIC